MMASNTPNVSGYLSTSLGSVVDYVTDDVTSNQTDDGYMGFTEEQFRFLEASKIIRNISIPIIVLVGLTGNTLTVAVFLSRYMKTSSSKHFLTALACVDNFFLVALFISWFDGSVANILINEELCAIVVYITYVASFLSVWYVVGFTTERYIAICHQLKAPILCSNSREKTAVLLLATIAGVLYCFSFVTTSVEHAYGMYRCVNKVRYIDLLAAATWFDTIMTMVVPFILILVMNLKVVCRAGKFHQKRKHCMKPVEFGTPRAHQALRSKPQMRVTRTLVLVSTTFLVLNLPSHVLRLYTLILNFTSSQETTQMQTTRYLIQEITQLIYYTTFSVNFFLYALYGKHFQRSLLLSVKLIRRKLPCYNEMSKHAKFRCGSFNGPKTLTTYSDRNGTTRTLISSE